MSAWRDADHAALARRLGAERAAPEAAALARLAELVGVVYRLRDADGCPWDRQQTVESMSRNLLEEAAEVADAIAARRPEHVAEELGDVLMNVVLMARIAEQEGRAGLDVVCQRIAEKLVRRHPHVFGAVSAEDAEAALASWNESKAAEAGAREGSALDGVPPHLPALLAARKLGGKAADVGFDWPDAGGALVKLDEELGELHHALDAAGGGASDAVADELGDVLFAAVNVARKLGLDPELVLRRTCDKFRRRFAAVERELGPGLEAASLEQMEAAWRRAAEGGA